MRLPTVVASLIASLVIATLAMSPRDSAAETDSDSPKKLRHAVLFKFKEDASKEDVQKVVDGFRALPDKIPVIADFEYGTNNSPEGFDKGFTHMFLVTFRSEEDRAVYIPHPEHKKFVDVLLPHIDDVLVIDYWAQK